MLKVSRGEMVEKELDRLIERRSRNGETDADEQEDLWKESARRHKEAIRRENCAGWYGYHMHMSELHARLAAEHERRAARLCEKGS